MDNHKQEFRVRDLPTRSVTLFPTQAQVVRDINDVVLRPGANQIVVVGLTPTVDENSIKVEGTGAAIISDIAVELLPNRDIFEEVYPDEDADLSTDSESDFESEDDLVHDALKEIRKQLKLKNDDLQRAREKVASAEARLDILNAYGKMLDRKRDIKIDEGLALYRSERDVAFTDRMAGAMLVRTLSTERDELEKEERREERVRGKAFAKRTREKQRAQKARAARDRRRAEAQREKRRVRDERVKFWPRKCYTVRITLDAPSFHTPSSSRRSSVSSETEIQAVDETDVTKEVKCDLSLSYVTSGASWAPTYDLQLATTTNSAALCFDAKLTNTTSESWTECKIVLSTSQTTFLGLNDTIPALVPWRLRLAGKPDVLNGETSLTSREEKQHRAKWQADQRAHQGKDLSRYDLFGLAPKAVDVAVVRPNGKQMAFNHPPQLMQQAQTQLQMQMQQHQQQAANFGATVPQAFGAAPAGAALFGTSNNNVGAPPAIMPQARINAPGPHPYMARRTSPTQQVSDEEMSDDDCKNGMFDLDASTPDLAYEESAFEETGMTTTYDLPGRKALVPSSTASKQRVARVSFSSVALSHTVVPKYRPVAYLKAKFKNASKLTLLKGPVGLTLDGSFVGRTTLPLCSAGDHFSLGLGVDPTVKVVYPKPDVVRATTGFLSKEDSNAYARSVSITNTRAAAGKAISLVVFDQVPLSEDERLRVDLQAPLGLTVGGSSVATGNAVATATGKTVSAGDQAKDWGRAVATLKKDGLVVWDVSLNAGKTVKLDLAYDISLPKGDSVVQA